MKKLLLVFYALVCVPVIYTLIELKIVDYKFIISYVVIICLIGIIYYLIPLKVLGHFVIVAMIVLQIFIVGYTSSFDTFINRYGIDSHKNISLIMKKTRNKSKSDRISKNLVIKSVDDYHYYEQIANKFDAHLKMVYGYADFLAVLDNDIDQMGLLSEYDIQRVRELYSNFDADYEIVTSYAISDVYRQNRNQNFQDKSYNTLLTSTNSLGLFFDTGKSEINAIITVNPIKRKLLITYFDGDLAFENVCQNNELTSLSNIGYSGTACSMQSVASKIGIPINYYLKFWYNSPHYVYDSRKEILDESGTLEPSIKQYFSSEFSYMKKIVAKDNKVVEELQSSTAKLDHSFNYLKVIKLLSILYQDTKTDFLHNEIKKIISTFMLSSKDWIVERTLIRGNVEKGYYDFDNNHAVKMYDVGTNTYDQVYRRIIDFMR